MARVSSRKRSLIEWSWSSIPFNAASTADKSVTLVAGYTAICKQQHQHQHPWMKTWTKKRRVWERERDCCGQWRGLEARQCECWTKTSTTPETCLLLLSSPPYLSLSLSNWIELNYSVWFLRLWSLLCDCNLLLFWNPGKWFWREHWLCFPQFVFQTTPSQVCSLATYDGLNYKFVFFFFFKELQILYLKKKKIEEKHYFGS